MKAPAQTVPTHPPSSEPEIRLVIFDLGRVLMRICNDWEEACRRAGINVPRVKLDAAAQGSLHEIACRSDIGAIDIEGFISSAAPVLGLTPTQVRAMSHAFLYGPFAGSVELVEDITRCGVITACLSNTNESHWRIMNDPAEAAHFPLHRLTHRFASHIVGARKPDAAIYEHVERETGVAPSAILFFDDIAENVDAAVKRGWHSYHVDPKSENPIPDIRTELRRRGVI